MASLRLVVRSSRLAASYVRPFSTSTARFNDSKNIFPNDRGNDNVDIHRQKQMEKPLNPHLTNTNSTVANELPSVGKDSAPPEMISSVDGDFVPKDSVPENTERMTGRTQKPAPDSGANADLDVGEIEGGTFKVEPLRRTGEDVNTTRARLLCSFLQTHCAFLISFADAFLSRRPKQEKRDIRIRPPPFHFCR